MSTTNNLSQKYISLFESIKHTSEGGEYWLARELKDILGYTEWRKFEGVLNRAKTALNQTGNSIESHFVPSAKMVEAGVAPKEVDDYMLSRYACYLISLNGDPRKEVIAQAQIYFITKARQKEVDEERVKNSKNRPELRKQFTDTYIDYKENTSEHGVSKNRVAHITTAGDKKLFNHSTKEMKEKFEIPNSHVLSDYLAPVPLIARTLSIEMTNEAMIRDELYGYDNVKTAHEQHNEGIRKILVEKGMAPEDFPKMERVKTAKMQLEDPNADEMENNLQQMIASQADLFSDQT